MKLLSAALLLTVLGASSVAIGQQEMQRDRDFAQGRGSRGGQHSLPGRSVQSRGGNVQQSLGNAPSGQSETEQRAIHEHVQGKGNERLSPEERRQLRQDINAAGHDIYRRTRAE